MDGIIRAAGTALVQALSKSLRDALVALLAIGLFVAAVLVTTSAASVGSQPVEDRQEELATPPPEPPPPRYEAASLTLLGVHAKGWENLGRNLPLLL